MPNSLIFCIILFVIAAPLIIWLNFIISKKRRMAFQKEAQKLGLTYSEFDPTRLELDEYGNEIIDQTSPIKQTSLGLLSNFANFAPMLLGHENQPIIRDLLVGKVGLNDLYVFDYRYLISRTGDNGNRIYSFSVISFDIKKLGLPIFQIIPKKSVLTENLGNYLNNDYVELLEYPEFFEKYRLRTPNIHQFRSIFSRELAIKLIELAPLLTFESDGNYLLCYSDEYKITPLNLKSRIDAAISAMDILNLKKQR